LHNADTIHIINNAFCGIACPVLQSRQSNSQDSFLFLLN